MKIEVVYNPDVVQVLFDGLIHLSLNRHRLRAVHSWANGDGWYSIQFHLEGVAPIECDYDDFHKWQSILAGLQGMHRIPKTQSE